MMCETPTPARVEQAGATPARRCRRRRRSRRARRGRRSRTRARPRRASRCRTRAHHEQPELGAAPLELDSRPRAARGRRTGTRACRPTARGGPRAPRTRRARRSARRWRRAARGRRPAAIAGGRARRPRRRPRRALQRRAPDSAAASASGASPSSASTAMIRSRGDACSVRSQLRQQLEVGRRAHPELAPADAVALAHRARDAHQPDAVRVAIRDDLDLPAHAASAAALVQAVADGPSASGNDAGAGVALDGGDQPVGAGHDRGAAGAADEP